MDAILFKMISRSMIIIAMIVTLLFFVIKRKKFHNKLTNKEDAILKIIAAILVCTFVYKMEDFNMGKRETLFSIFTNCTMINDRTRFGCLQWTLTMGLFILTILLVMAFS